VSGCVIVCVKEISRDLSFVPDINLTSSIEIIQKVVSFISRFFYYLINFFFFFIFVEFIISFLSPLLFVKSKNKIVFWAL
jgi:hypothetical protein